MSSDPVGKVLGGTYQVTRIIGEGGMGMVYEASHVRIQRRFAIKVLNIKLAESNEALTRFEREAMIGSRLGHDHIIQVVDFNHTSEGYPYIVMELLEGHDLGQAIKNDGRFSLVRAASIIRHVCLALTAAHGEGVIHRDLKPENIFLTTRQGGGELAKVMDFGISKVLTADSTLTSHAAVMGTPWYMAPEQAEGRVKEIDHRSDIFSVGLIFYYILSGQMPFDGPSVPSILFQVVHKPPPPLLEARPDLPQGVVEVIDKAIAKAQDDRYDSSAALIADLAQAMGEDWKSVLMQEMGDGLANVPHKGREAPAPPHSSGTDVASCDTMAAMPGQTGPHRPQAASQSNEAFAATMSSDMAIASTMQSSDSIPPLQPPQPTTMSSGAGEMTGPYPQQPAPAGKSRMAMFLAACLALLGIGGGVTYLFTKDARPLKVTASVALPAPARTPTPATAPEPPPAAPPAQPKPAPLPDPATAPAAETRALSFFSTPPGASVLVGGKKIGKTPLEKHPAAKEDLRVVFRKSGYAKVLKTVPAGGEAASLRVILRALPASLSVVALHQGKPVEATIYLDGKKVDQTPALLTNLKPGKHTLRLTHKDFPAQTRPVNLRPSQRGRVVMGFR